MFFLSFWNLLVRDAIVELGKQKGLNISSYNPADRNIVDGNDERAFINNFVDNEFLSVDSLAFRQYLTSITPDVDMTTQVVNSAGEEIEVTIPVTLRLFWPDARV